MLTEDKIFSSYIEHRIRPEYKDHELVTEKYHLKALEGTPNEVMECLMALMYCRLEDKEATLDSENNLVYVSRMFNRLFNYNTETPMLSVEIETEYKHLPRKGRLIMVRQNSPFKDVIENPVLPIKTLRVFSMGLPSNFHYVITQIGNRLYHEENTTWDNHGKHLICANLIAPTVKELTDETLEDETFTLKDMIILFNKKASMYGCDDYFKEKEFPFKDYISKIHYSKKEPSRFVELTFPFKGANSKINIGDQFILMGLGSTHFDGKPSCDDFIETTKSLYYITDLLNNLSTGYHQMFTMKHTLDEKHYKESFQIASHGMSAYIAQYKDFALDKMYGAFVPHLFFYNIQENLQKWLEFYNGLLSKLEETILKAEYHLDVKNVSVFTMLMGKNTDVNIDSKKLEDAKLIMELFVRFYNLVGTTYNKTFKNS